MRRGAFLGLALICATLGGCLLAHAQGVVSVPQSVVSVNGQTGSVIIPTSQRIVSQPLDASSGSATFTFANSSQVASGTPANFNNKPTCWASVATSASNTVFSQVVTTAISTSSVTVSMRGATTILSLLSLGTLTVWNNPPSGTTVTLSCIGALP